MTQSTVRPLKILFVCVGNACRSQMAEAWANHLGKGRVQASSAGTHPYGTVVEDTCAVMSEKGVSVKGQWSKGLRDVAVAEMDVVINMGRGIEFPVPEDFNGCVVEWNVPDPFARETESFRNVRDMIERLVRGLLADLLAPDVSA
jgi:arsenate reductase (thioredoxin)